MISLLIKANAGYPGVNKTFCIPASPAFISVISGMKGFAAFVLPLDGMLVHRRVTPSITSIDSQL